MILKMKIFDDELFRDETNTEQVRYRCRGEQLRRDNAEARAGVDHAPGVWVPGGEFLFGKAQLCQFDSD